MAEIRGLVLDVDGVLTDGRLYYGGGSEPLRAFHIHDGLAIGWFQKLGGVVAIVTGKSSVAVEHRAANLGIEHVVQGSDDKLGDLKKLLPAMDVSIEEVAMVGDDLLDLPIMNACGYPIAVSNAVDEVKAAAKYVTQRAGGEGAVREAVEHLMRQDGSWERVLEHFGAAEARASNPAK